MIRFIIFGVLALILLGGVIILLVRIIPWIDNKLLQDADRAKLIRQAADAKIEMEALEAAREVGEAARRMGVGSEEGGGSGIGERLERDCSDAEKGVKAGRDARERLNKLGL